MRVAIKCYAPEMIDCVTHAVIDFEIGLITDLAMLMVLAKNLKDESKFELMDFEALRYREFSPTFLDCSPETLGMTQLEFEALEGGFAFLSAKMENHTWESVSEICSMSLCSLVVCPERILWEGRIKHDDSGAHIETYGFYLKDLREIAEKLGFGICECGSRVHALEAICSDCRKTATVSQKGVVQ